MKCPLLVFFFLLPLSVLAQKNSTTADVAFAAGGGAFSPAVSYNKLWGFGEYGKFKIGLGLRLTSFFGNDIDFRTAPARLTSGKESIVALFSEDIVANIDTLRMPRAQTNALNLSIHLQYSFGSRFDVGFNIDALGATFGGRKSGEFIARSQGRPVTIEPAKVTPFNLLLISDSDRGSLNSELYARYWVGPKVGIRAGLSFQFSEYTTDRKLTFDNDRFRAKVLMPLVAVSFRL
jgi:hypothetical protein